MIRNTFSILNGIGMKLERNLWKEGILTWDDFIDAKNIEIISPERKRAFDESLSIASGRLAEGNAAFFARTVKRREHWRFYENFGGDAVCLDIETNGYQPERGGYVTMVGLYDGFEWRALVAGENLTTENLNRELSGYKYLITYYGASFDIPYLQRTFTGVRFDMLHFDLCYAAKKLGMNGGLKRLEESLEIERDVDVKGMDGYAAVKLWETARRGNDDAMRLLMLYNREDTVNLMKIAGILYQRLRHSTGIEEYLSCGVG